MRVNALYSLWGKYIAWFKNLTQAKAKHKPTWREQESLTRAPHEGTGPLSSSSRGVRPENIPANERLRDQSSAVMM